MRIQNNITAMNTHRQYTINNDNVAKAAEKLSSGYRINRAGDDAAGLAISEKMRSQIRGLNMATKNSQDAISLVQTAEGALQETHSMLQRMNELAVQSATGTNETLDRDALAKEFEQLKREINDVAEQTTFNNMKILDGSKSYEGAIRSALTAGVTKTEATWSEGVAASDVLSAVQGTPDIPSKAGDPAVEAKDGKIVFKSDALKAVPKAGDNSVYTLKLTDKNGNDIAITANGSYTDTATTNNDPLGKKFNGATFKVNDAAGTAVTFTAAYNETTGELTFAGPNTGQKDVDLKSLGITASVVKTGTATTVAPPNVAVGTASATAPSMTYAGLGAIDVAANEKYSITIGADTFEVTGDGTKSLGDLVKDKLVVANNAKGVTDTNGGTVTFGAAVVGDDLVLTGTSNTYAANGSQTGVGFSYSKVASADTLTRTGVENAVEPKVATAPTQGETTRMLDNDKLQNGDVIKINGKSYTIGDEEGQVQKGATAAATVANLAAAVEKEEGTDPTKTITFTDNGDGSFTVKQGIDGNDLKGSASVKFVAGDGATTKTTIEFDVAKLKAGDKISFTIGDDPFDLEITEEMVGDREAILAAIDEALEDVEGAERKGNAIIVKGKNVSDAKLEWDKESEEANAMRIQVGALENEQLNISIDSMNTAGLGLDEHRIDDQDAAGKAITAVRDAINKVSDQRATLGAMQNRLDHKIANLKVSSENLSAAESRIRDVDMASEMTNFTKNNILSQAATAMLAQANALPQNVLSLLG